MGYTTGSCPITTAVLAAQEKTHRIYRAFDALSDAGTEGHSVTQVAEICSLVSDLDVALCGLAVLVERAARDWSRGV